MIKYCLVLSLLPASKAISCHKVQAGTIPSCIESKIELLKSGSKRNPAAEVQQYNYNGKTVYLFNAPCCDQFNVVYDDSCNYVCAPSGGFTGKGDQKCIDFAAKAKLIKVVWKDER